jgi:hypothetical protein
MSRFSDNELESATMVLFRWATANYETDAENSQLSYIAPRPVSLLNIAQFECRMAFEQP